MARQAVNKGDIITNDTREGDSYLVYDVKDALIYVECVSKASKNFGKKFIYEGGFYKVPNVTSEIKNYADYITIDAKVNTNDFKLIPIK